MWNFLIVIALALLLNGDAHAQASGRVVIPDSDQITVDDDDDVDTLETLFDVDVRGYSSLTLCGTVATAAFTDFDIALSNDGTNFVTYYTASADYTTPEGFLHSVSADPTTWTTTRICLTLNELDSVREVRFSAAGANSDGTFTVRVQ